MRKKLKYLRVIENDLSITEMAKRIGVSRETYAEVENGSRPASQAFLGKLQKAFSIPDCEIWLYGKNEGV